MVENSAGRSSLSEDVIVVLSDGEILKGRARVPADDRAVIVTLSALVSLSAGLGQFPVTVDIAREGRRFMAVALDAEIIFVRIGTSSASRAEFLEEIRVFHSSERKKRRGTS